MCGIVGGVDINWNSSVLDSIRHRGPDDAGWYEHDGVSLGHTRLSIQDLSANGHQPMASLDGNLVLAFNGEIYNHWDLRKELQAEGIVFTSSSDTETLLYGWQIWGETMLPRLNGIFAFAILDLRENRLFLARDPSGVKPLYIYQSKTGIAFSSELKALMEIESLAPTLCSEGLENHITYLWSPGETTLLKQVTKLLPGHMLTYDLQRRTMVSKKRYSEIIYQGHKAKLSEAQWIDALDEALQQAVKDQMLSDVPVGFFLSGGLDSSLLVAMAKKMYPHEAFPCFTVKTTNLGNEEGFADDLPYAEKVADHLKVPLHVVDAEIDLFREFDDMIWHLDEPQADIAPLYVSHIAQAAKEKMGVKVLLSGAGGDDVFSGYRRHQALSMERLLSFVPKPIRKATKSIIELYPPKKPFVRRLHKLVKDWDKEKSERIVGYFNWLPYPGLGKEILHPQHRKANHNYAPNDYFLQLWHSLPNEVNDLDRLLFLEQMTFLVDHNLNYTDKMSMKHGVEVRVPYLAPSVLSLSATMPVTMKMNSGTTKYVLRKVAERYLPKEVIYRSKTGFGAPVRRWITSTYKDEVENRLSELELSKTGLFDVATVHRIIRENSAGIADYSYILLSILTCQSWYKQFMLKSK